MNKYSTSLFLSVPKEISEAYKYSLQFVSKLLNSEQSKLDTEEGI